MKIWRKRITDSISESVNELINHEAVYRTAPATPGLLIMCLIVIWSLFVQGNPEEQSDQDPAESRLVHPSFLLYCTVGKSNQGILKI